MVKGQSTPVTSVYLICIHPLDIGAHTTDLHLSMSVLFSTRSEWNGEKDHGLVLNRRNALGKGNNKVGDRDCVSPLH